MEKIGGKTCVTVNCFRRKRQIITIYILLKTRLFYLNKACNRRDIYIWECIKNCSMYLLQIYRQFCMWYIFYVCEIIWKYFFLFFFLDYCRSLLAQLAGAFHHLGVEVVLILWPHYFFLSSYHYPTLPYRPSYFSYHCFAFAQVCTWKARENPGFHWWEIPGKNPP